MLSADGSTQVGKISKEWSGIGKELFTDADTFGISFPMDLDVKIKAVLVGAVLLIVSTAISRVNMLSRGSYNINRNEGIKTKDNLSNSKSLA